MLKKKKADEVLVIPLAQATSSGSVFFSCFFYSTGFKEIKRQTLKESQEQQ